MSFEEFDALLDSGAEAPPEDAPPTSCTLPVVLVVDDDEIIRQSLEALLSDRYRLILCASADEAVAAFNADVSAVVLDVKMRGRDGFWACQELRKLDPDIPVIFHSAYQDAKNPFAIINEHRPFAYIIKDGSAQPLRVAVETATRLFQSTLRMRRLIERLQDRRSVES